MSHDAAAAFNGLIDLASATLGGQTLACSDDFFAGMESMLQPGRALFVPGKYTERGKWMDGWETRRRRSEGHDWAIVRLGARGLLTRVEIDTNHFKGNYPDRASVDGCFAPNAGNDVLQAASWTPILPETKMSADKRHYFAGKQLQHAGPFSHVRLNMFPDGGISRLRVYGRLAVD